MNTKTKRFDDTDTEASETSNPAGVGELATSVVISSSGNASLNMETEHLDYNDMDLINRNCYSAPLRLRGGASDDDVDDVVMTDNIDTSGDMGNAGSCQKRGPPSPGGSPSALPAKQKKISSKHPRELDELFGWLEQTIKQEKDKKKLGVLVAEGMLGKLSQLRAITREITHENSRLEGEVRGKDVAQRESLRVFINKLDAKNVEVSSLTAELKTLRSGKAAPNEAPRPIPETKPTYAAKTAAGPPKATTKSRKTNDKDSLAKSRNIKATSRFVIEVPQDMTVARAKAGIWETVKSKIKNPKAKTIVSGKTVVIIPDDDITLEVMKGMQDAIEIGPKRPRVILYDVDINIGKDELIDCLATQNDGLSLTADDVKNMRPLHKLGPRDGDVVHWVLEAPPSAIPKIENRPIYIGMTRCRCKVHSSLPQCFNCQQYGHTAIRCELKTPICRNCAGAHDSRTCKEETIKCANCKGPHKASSATCKAKNQATRNLLRRTDFGPQ